MNELEEISRRLHWLRTVRPTRERRAEVEALLESKWDGVEVLAGQVLAAWGGRESVEPLRRWLERLLARPDPGTSVVRPAAVALGQCVREEDVEWALDLYFRAELDHRGEQHEIFPLVLGQLFPLLQGLPQSSIVRSLERRAAQGDEGARRALRSLEAAAANATDSGQKS